MNEKISIFNFFLSVTSYNWSLGQFPTLQKFAVTFRKWPTITCLYSSSIESQLLVVPIRCSSTILTLMVFSLGHFRRPSRDFHGGGTTTPYPICVFRKFISIISRKIFIRRGGDDFICIFVCINNFKSNQNFLWLRTLV